MKFRLPDSVSVYPETNTDSDIIIEEEADSADVYIKSISPLDAVMLEWQLSDSEMRKEPVKVMGDAWERSYADLHWDTPDGKRIMPWYFAVSNGSDSSKSYSGRYTECFGVGVLPDAMCSWEYNGKTIKLFMDVRNGGVAVKLDGRKIHAAKIIFSEYYDISAFDALCEFCKEMSPAPLKTDKIIYGSNNWYYAYGKSSKEDILKDTQLIASLCKGNKNQPYMVIDDGWQPNATNPPWTPNSKFGDMKKLADEMKQAGVIPGIWLRFLCDEKSALSLPQEAKRGKSKDRLDPTHPLVKEFIISTTKQIAGWGYELIKHDFSTFDICGQWGRDMNEFVCCGDEGFYDKSKTTAQIIKDFYKLILENAGEALILGCNTVSHLSPGLVHASRIGDDTSGVDWKRTVDYGVNTLSFRLCQNHSFYIADADCIGITNKIDWAKNSRWLKLLSESGTPLFASSKPSDINSDIFKELKAAFSHADAQNDRLIPLDWMENKVPHRYMINGKEYIFAE